MSQLGSLSYCIQTLKAYACYYIIVQEKQEDGALQGKPEAEDSIKAEGAVTSLTRARE